MQEGAAPGAHSSHTAPVRPSPRRRLETSDLQATLEGGDGQQGQVLLLFSIAYQVHVHKLLHLGEGQWVSQQGLVSPPRGRHHTASCRLRAQTLPAGDRLLQGASGPSA
jgi:hypothetical protein